MLCVVFLVKAQIRYGNVFPLTQAVPYGSSTQIACYSATFVTWKMGVLQRLFSKQLANTIYISNMGTKNIGTYKCLGTYPNRTAFVNQAVIYAGCELVIMVCNKKIKSEQSHFELRKSHTVEHKMLAQLKLNEKY